jgi:hypothetical protein
MGHHPTPNQEGLPFFDSMKCAFRSLTQLSKWFTMKEINAMLKLGLEIREIKVKRAFHGKRQSVYYKKDRVK